MKLLLLGCTGLIGCELVPLLQKKGHELTIISRQKFKNLDLGIKGNKINYIQLDPSILNNWSNVNLLEELKSSEGVINLAGEPIASKRWTREHCSKLVNSRRLSTQGLINAIKETKSSPKVLINGSAIGYYGTSYEEIFDEDSPKGNDFLSKICTEWEDSAYQLKSSTRLLIIRTGIVIAKDGGALGKMIPIFRSGFGGAIGSGEQWMSWIHRNDLCNMIAEGLTNNSWSGVINGVAPNPVKMKEFSQTLGNCLNRPSLIPVPGLILKFLLGDGAKVVLEGQYVKSNRLNKVGFKFKFNNIFEAINDAILIK